MSTCWVTDLSEDGIEWNLTKVVVGFGFCKPPATKIFFG
jgi:hypothetical protein